VKYLVDANVLSTPTKPAPDPRIVRWLKAHEQDIAVDPVILAELRSGGGRLYCLEWDADTGLKWAELLARLRTTGKAMPIKDSFIAATAAVHGLAIATRNRADFAHAGVRVVDPFVG